jgi:hypothetical protein
LFTKKNKICLQNTKYLSYFLLAFVLMCNKEKSLAQLASFKPATTSEMVFPLPFLNFPLSTSTAGGGYGSFYDNRYGLGAYHYNSVPQHKSATGSLGSSIKDLYLYSFNHNDMGGVYGGYTATLVYRFTKEGDTETLQRGHINYGGDVSQGAVAPYMMNGNLYVAIAYWYGVPTFELNHYLLDEENEGLVPAGLTTGSPSIPPSNIRIKDLPSGSYFNPRISMDASKLDRFAMVYEVPDSGIFIRGYRVSNK